MLPRDNELTICFAHVAYRLHEQFSTLHTGIRSFAVRDPEGLERRVGEADVLVISGLWQDRLLDRAKKLRFIQAIGAGTDQFPQEELAKRGVRLASARGVNYRAVSEHAMGDLVSLLPEADFVALTCPLTRETENLMDAEAFARMKPSAYLVNVARGRVVDEAALIAALGAGHIAGAGLDVTAEEPLAASSPLWGMPQVLITPHTAGETSRYEDNVIEILRDNVDRLWRGERQLRNQVV